VASGLRILGKITGLEDALRRLESVDAKVRRKALRDSVNEGGKIVKAAAKSRVPHGETNLLDRSINVRVKVYRNSGVAVSIVGPATGFRTAGRGRNRRRVRTSLGEKYLKMRANPSKYAHLVEKGTRAHSLRKGEQIQKVRHGLLTGRGTRQTGKIRKGSQAKPFMQPAFDSTKDQVQATMRGILAAAVEEGAKG